MQTLLQDLRYSLRQLIRSPGFTLTAVVSLALGIGATSAVFSIIYAALLNPFPYPSAGRIVRPILASKSSPEYMAELTGPQIRQLRQKSVVEDVLAMDFQALTLSTQGLQQPIHAIGLISSGFHDLGVAPALGRGILPSDSVDGHDPEPVAVLSYKSWEKYFSKRPDVLGKVVQLDHKNYAIIIDPLISNKEACCISISTSYGSGPDQIFLDSPKAEWLWEYAQAKDVLVHIQCSSTGLSKP